VSLRLFADHCVSNFVIRYLRDAGNEVLRLKDFIPPESPDDAVILEAQRLNSLLLSHNGDFADIVSYPPGNYQGIITLQVRNHPEVLPYLLETFRKYCSANPEMDHYRGKLFIVEADRIRVRE
jgi:predicted nuclease of predicted toxin-antitoxin system